jgi:hypothetical protein
MGYEYSIDRNRRDPVFSHHGNAKQILEKISN